MEETKELQTTYKIFRYLIYLSLIVEFFEYAINPELLDYWGGILCDIHGRIKRWYIYQDGNLIWSKIATFILICITCIGTRNKKLLQILKAVLFCRVCQDVRRKNHLRKMPEGLLKLSFLQDIHRFSHAAVLSFPCSNQALRKNLCLLFVLLHISLVNAGLLHQY